MKYQVNVLRTISDLPNYCKDEGEFGATLLDNDKKFTVTLTLRLSSTFDQQLDDMKKFIHGQHVVETNPTMEHWWKPGNCNYL